jgi:hypothetical protein
MVWAKGINCQLSIYMEKWDMLGDGGRASTKGSVGEKDRGVISRGFIEEGI